MRAPTPAEKLLLSLGIDSAKEIDVEAIAWDAGAEVRFAELDSCEARIIGYGNRAIITVEERSILPRKRFSVAHELGHWKYHRGRSFVCRKDDIGNQVKGPTDPERVADSYAADLLLPSFLFVPMAAKIRKASFEAVDEIRAELAKYPSGVEVVFVQDEPANMGAWPFMALKLPHHIEGLRMSRVSRPASSSPAVGSAKLHQAEQEALLSRLF